MLIQINRNIAAAAQDLINVQDFGGKMEAKEKMFLFFELIMVLLCIFMVETKIS